MREGQVKLLYEVQSWKGKANASLLYEVVFHQITILDKHGRIGSAKQEELEIRWR